jgi:hypothetical protein
VTTIAFKRGDNKNIGFVVLDDPSTQPGVWTWDGSTTILATDTTGVSVGDWTRATDVDGCATPGVFLKITAVTPNTSVTVENPLDLTIPIGVTGAEASSPVDLTGAVVKAAAKKRFSDPNSQAVIFSTSYLSPVGIEIVDAVGGECTWRIRPQDTHDAAPGDYGFDIEVTQQGSSITVAGTATFTLASSVVELSLAADVALMSIGDIIVPAGIAGNDKPFTITDTPVTDENLTSTQVRTDYASFVDQAAVAFTLFTADRKTPDGLSGTITLIEDVVS